MNQAKLMTGLRWAGSRLREASSYAGLAGVLAAAHIADASSWAHVIECFGMGLGGVIAIVLPEGKR